MESSLCLYALLYGENSLLLSQLGVLAESKTGRHVHAKRTNGSEESTVVGLYYFEISCALPIVTVENCLRAILID